MRITQTVRAALTHFHWEPQPKAFNYMTALVAELVAECPAAANVAERMKAEAGTRFIDWIDFIRLPKTTAHEAKLGELGFDHHPEPGAHYCFRNEKGIFPAVILETGAKLAVGIKVDSIADFCAAWNVGPRHTIIGEPGSQFRMCRACSAAKAELWVVERHGYRGFATVHNSAEQTLRAHKHLEALRRRDRDCYDDLAGFDHANELVDHAITDLGRDWTCDLFFQSERDYWHRRNRAAQVQKARQDKLGLGWANHDHHTYRSSRHCYKHLIAFFEKLGFHCRERFYAGAEAGWGAQVIEQSVTGITIFADVDMTAEELIGHFAHYGLTPKHDLGTVGLWCALHGEAFLQAGMHHLECTFDWQALKDQLKHEANIKTMDPFTTFPYLRQAFTEGEWWKVDEQRIGAVLAKGQITEKQAAEFRSKGAIGSHLENLERNDGFKGFNQTGVSHIIARTDPRKLVKEAAVVGA